MNLSRMLSSQTNPNDPVQRTSPIARFALPSQGSIPPINHQQLPNLPTIPGMMQQQPIRIMPPSLPQVKGASSSSFGMDRRLEGPATKKSKIMNFEDGGSDDEDGKVRTGNKQSTEAKRSQHCEVEKRRRERMNRYMAELAQMIPACNAVPRRLDKLSILKMAVDHMKNLRGDPHASSDYKPGFLTDEELKQLVVEAANGFMLIIQCNQAKILFVSDTVSEVLSEEPDSWIGSCLYDLLHPKDIQKVKEQLSCFDIDEAKKAGNIKQSVASSPLIIHGQSMNGLRRSFLCRIKKLKSQKSSSLSSDPPTSEINCNNSESVIKLLQSTEECIPYQYAVLHCTGFIRNLTTSEKEALHVDETSMGACLVAVARLQHFGDNVQKPKLNASENEFVARIGVDGRFTYVDPRVAGVLGYLPQDLIGQICYEYYHPEDIQKMVHLHHDAMRCRTPMPTVQYRFLTKNQKWLWLAMKAFSFINPFSRQVEYVVCTNVTMLSSGIDCPGEIPTSTNTEEKTDSANIGLPNCSPAETSNDVDKQERIERYVRMTIQNQAESMLARNSENTRHFSSGASIGDTGISNDSALQVLSTPAMTTIEENAAAVQRILEDYNKIHVTPLHRKDMNYNFPEGLFNSEVDLEGSREAYRNILTEFDNPANFTSLFNQVEADPMRLNSIFQDVSMDIFD